MTPDYNTVNEKIFAALENFKAKNFIDAEKLYKEILELKPNHYETICYLGLIYAQTKKLDLSCKMFLKALKMNPENAGLNNNLGNIFFELGNIEKSIDYFQKAIKIDPKFIDAYFNLSLAFKNVGKLDEAINSLKKIIFLKPNDLKSIISIAIIYQNEEKIEQSFLYFIKAMKVDPNDLETRNLFLELIKTTNLHSLTKKYPKEIKNIFLFFLKQNNINHDDIFNNAKLFIYFHQDKEKVERIYKSQELLLDNDNIKQNLTDEYFYLMLQKCLFRDIFLENFLTKIRREILLDLSDKKKKILKNYLNFIISLSQQCFFNEYLFFETNEEKKALLKLENKIINNNSIDELEVAIFACYKLLNEFQTLSNSLLKYRSKNILFTEMVNLQIIEPLKENDLKKTIKSIEKISNQTSLKVREQYEQNPYPRWRYAKSTKIANFSDKFKKEIFPNKKDFINNFSNPNVLIAGCGTGKHLAHTIYYENANISAIDLSLSSIAYAKRMIEEIGYEKINFLKGDILSLKNLNTKFDIIECVGVLHHMEKPIEGLEILINLLKSNGVIKLGLYSELARGDVVKIRDLIKKEGINNSLESIRYIREKVKNNSDNSLFKKISMNYDFFSTSNVRDLIFHVKEHRFSIPSIKKILNDLKLEFLGFSNPYIKKKYSINFPDDKKNILLDNWQKFEQKYPDSFYDMYQFWLKKLN